MATSFFRGFQRGFERGVPLGVSEARQSRAEQLQAQANERQQTMQAVGALNTVLGMRPGAFRDFAAKQVATTFGFGPDATKMMQKAKEDDSRLLRDLYARGARAGMTLSQMREAGNNPEAFTALLSHLETRDREFRFAMQGGPQAVAGSPTQPPPAAQAQPPAVLGPPMMPGGAVTPFVLREPIVQGERGTLPPIQAVPPPGAAAPAGIEPSGDQPFDALSQEIDRLNTIETRLLAMATEPQARQALGAVQSRLSRLREQQKRIVSEGRRSGEQRVKLRQAIRGEGTVKLLQTAQQAFNIIQGGVQSDNNIGDLAIISGFARLLDPGSVVRPAEFETVQGARGLRDRIESIVPQLARGDRLLPRERQNFIQTARRIMQKYIDLVNKEVVPIWQPIAEGEGLQIRDLIIVPPGFNLQGGSSRQRSGVGGASRQRSGVGGPQTSTGLSPQAHERAKQRFGF